LPGSDGFGGIGPPGVIIGGAPVRGGIADPSDAAIFMPLRARDQFTHENDAADEAASKVALKAPHSRHRRNRKRCRF
jgi:hypothetical protein